MIRLASGSETRAMLLKNAGIEFIQESTAMGLNTDILKVFI